VLTHGLRFDVNCSILFTELPLLKRPAAAGGQAAATMGFRIDLHHKDMGIAMAAARDADASLPMTGLVDQLIAAARAQGCGKLDHSALLKVIESLSGQAGADAGSHGL
jgi:2-hydroxy-3-oxopropionate reductase